MRGSLLLLSCSLVLLGSVQAQTPEPESSPSPEPRGAAELPLLESEMAESAYLSDRSEANRDTLVFAYEKVVNATCFGALMQKLEYAGNPVDPYCLQYIDKILRLDERNPIAICARDGMEADSCKKAFEEQETRTFVFKERAGKGDPGESEVRLNYAKNQAAIIAKAEELGQQRAQYESQPTPELKQSIAANFRGLLFLSCQVSKIRLRPLSEMPPTPAPHRAIIAKDPSLATLESAIDALGSKDPRAGQAGKKEQAPAPASRRDEPQEEDVYSRTSKTKNSKSNGEQKTLFHRVHLITSTCADYISQALAFDPGFPEAICYRESLVAPACIKALKKARARRAGTSGFSRETREPKGGLDSF